MEIVGDVEERAVAIGDAAVEREQIGGHCGLIARCLHLSNCIDGGGRSIPTNGRAAAADVGSDRSRSTTSYR